MSAPPAIRPRGFLAANLGKLAVAFLAGFLVFAAGFIFIVKRHQHQIRTPIRPVVPPERSATIALATNPSSTAAAPTGQLQPAAPASTPVLGSPAMRERLASTASEPARKTKRRRRNTVPQTGPPVTTAKADALATKVTERDLASAAEDSRPATVAPPPPAMLTVPPDTVLQVRVSDELSSKKSQADQTFHGNLTAPLSVDGITIAPAGAAVQGRIVGVRRGGIFGDSLLTLELTTVETATGTPLDVKTTQWYRNGDRHRFPAPRSSDVNLRPGSQITFRLLRPLTTSRP